MAERTAQDLLAEFAANLRALDNLPRHQVAPTVGQLIDIFGVTTSRAIVLALVAVAEAAQEMFRKIDEEGYHVNAPCIEIRDKLSALHAALAGEKE